MLATVPDNLVGIESDLVRIAQIFKQEFNANWQSVLVEDEQEWEKWKSRIPKAPENKAPTKKELLDQFETGLKKAIDSKQQHFVLHYLMHGNKNGEIIAKDTGFDASEFTKIFTQNYKGKPIASQIEITIIAESCYSGSQLDTIINDLEKHKIQTKGVRVIAAASRDTSASTFIPNQNASVLGNSEIMKDRSGVMTYYLSYYFDLINSMKDQGWKINPPLGTMGHALAFIDRMAKRDGKSHQNLQAYYYSTTNTKIVDPESTKEKNEGKSIDKGKENEGGFGDDNERSIPSPKNKKDINPNGYYFSKKELLNTNEKMA